MKVGGSNLTKLYVGFFFLLYLMFAGKSNDYFTCQIFAFLLVTSYTVKKIRRFYGKIPGNQLPVQNSRCFYGHLFVEHF